jgi:pimeloyl-ACP methyl ester carboxylesterase
MVNTFRKDMPRPIVGIGHSMGGAQLAYLGVLHPRLMETLILVDPVVQRVVSLSGNFSPAFASANRRDKWPSREEAAKAMLRSKFYQAWDKRVFDRWIKYGLRDLPTQLHPETSATPGPLPATVSTEPTVIPTSYPQEVTLTTTKHQEVMTFLRPNFPARPGDKEPSSSEYSLTNSNINRRTHPDLTPTDHPLAPFYRGESMIVFQQLPHLRPSVLYVFGALSFLTEDPAVIEDKMIHTGTGAGGSGGRKEGRVDQVMVQGAGHLIPMEKVEESAEHAATWIGKEMSRWRVNEKMAEEEWGNLKGGERSVLTTRFVEELEGVMKGKVPPREKKGAKL